MIALPAGKAVLWSWRTKMMQQTFDKLRKLQVLIVDDNPGDRLLYQTMITETDPTTDFNFVIADSASVAMDWLSTCQPDCVLLDHVLPDCLGLDLLKALKQKSLIKAPIIMLTGFGDEATAVSAMQNGAHGYVSKRELDGKKLKSVIDLAVKTFEDQRLQLASSEEIHARNEQLELKYKQFESFYQGVLGKLRVPVSSVKETANRLADNRDFAQNVPLCELITKLKSTTDSLALTLQNLADNPHLSIGKLLISTLPCSIVKLVSETVNSHKARADKAGIRISVNIQPEIPDIPMDRYRIEQVLINLLDNALKFTPRGGWIYLTVDCYLNTPQHVSVSISDTGSGIEASALPRLFERNTFSDSSRESNSIGLGLHLCKEIVESHSGNISVDSGPETGTCITFTLPLEERSKPGIDPWMQSALGRMKPEWRMSA
jgi:signal transduction histidine kinase